MDVVMMTNMKNLLGGIYYKDKIVNIVRENIGNKKKGVRGLLRVRNYRKNFTRKLVGRNYDFFRHPRFVKRI